MAFVIGNRGKPKKFKSPRDLKKQIDQYFESCDNMKPDPHPYTIEGLCIVLDCCRQTLLNYESQEGYEVYFDTIARAKDRIQENKVVKAFLGKTNHNYVIFDLINNHKYQSPTQVIDHKSGGEKIDIPVIGWVDGQKKGVKTLDEKFPHLNDGGKE